MKKNKKNKKKKYLKIIILLLILGIIVLLVLNAKLKNIYIKGNVILKDQEIIEYAGIENYPKLIKLSIKNIESKIKMSPYVEKVKIRINIFGRMDIEVFEYHMLLKDSKDNKIYLSNGSKIDPSENIIGLPSLINVVDDNVLKEFLQKLDSVDKDILSKISEISYQPNEYDKDLFLFYMNDGNHVYITTTRLLNINKYEEVLATLEGKKGILYLDSGNHFKVFE